MTNSRDLNDLHPTLQRAHAELKKRMGTAPLGVSSTYRCADYQNYLYAQGRTRAGSIVTNAKGGESFHNYRLAFDIFKNIKGAEYSDLSFFKTAGAIWTSMGGVWGGHFTNIDYSHFEFSGGLAIKDLQKGAALPKDALMLWEKSKAPEKETPVEIKEDIIVRFNTIKELPTWAVEPVELLIKRGYLQGDGKSLDLSLDMVRLIVINYRAGLYK